MQENRRSFLKKTAMASAAVASPTFSTRVAGANEKIVLALIGGRNRGQDIVLSSVRDGAEIKTFCDIDDAILTEVGSKIEVAQGKKPQFEKDFRRVLDDPDIDAVLIGTPDHWHAYQAIAACQAGKDVYVEKPLCTTIEEGHRMRDAARRYERVVQVGTQRRSAAQFKSAVEFVASGKLGKVCLMKAWMCQVRESVGNPPDASVPPGVDYDLWLGPAPKRPFNPLRFHYNWRFFWDYCNSELGNQGIHMLDIALWAIAEMRGLENNLPSHVSGHGGIYWLDDAKEVPDIQTVTYDYGDLMLVWELRSFQQHHPIEGMTAGTAFYGTEGTLLVDHQGWKLFRPGSESDPAETFAGSDQVMGRQGGNSHTKNFLNAVKSRQRPNADIEIGRRSTALCHLGNISYHLGRDVRFDPKTETFGSDSEANALLRREYRSPWELPG
ncbi:MAG TPA: Gfo/Idh/MocA family oxidoreductase [Anaerolineales bacterium]|nr:Gfo/Idh/MocA family oxidoreductase [Anaerolineales bacterium]